MTVSTFNEGDLYVVRTLKHLSTNPDRKWANSYEFRATTAGDAGDLLTLGGALIDFEADMSLSTVVFDRILISTWSPDSVPYDPEAFISSSVTASGQNTAATDPQPLSFCLSVARQVFAGREGHIFLRGVLKEGDTTAPAGKPVLVDRAAIQAQLETAITDSTLDGYIGTTSRNSLQMVMVGKTAADVRVISALRAQGVSQLPTDHAWFNRTAPT